MNLKDFHKNALKRIKGRTNDSWVYEIYLNGELVDTTDKEGIAILKQQSAAFEGEAILRKVYNGSDYDPVLHNTSIYDMTEERWKDE